MTTYKIKPVTLMAVAVLAFGAGACSSPAPAPAAPKPVVAGPASGDVLKGFLPAALPGGYSRTDVTTEDGGKRMIGKFVAMMASTASATYQHGHSGITIKITDEGGTKFPGTGASLASMAGGGRVDAQTFERSAPGSDGYYAVIVADRFLVDASGGVKESQLKAAVVSLLPALETMAGGKK